MSVTSCPLRRRDRRSRRRRADRRHPRRRAAAVLRLHGHSGRGTLMLHHAPSSWRSRRRRGCHRGRGRGAPGPGASCAALRAEGAHLPGAVPASPAARRRRHGPRPSGRRPRRLRRRRVHAAAARRPRLGRCPRLCQHI